MGKGTLVWRHVSLAAAGLVIVCALAVPAGAAHAAVGGHAGITAGRSVDATAAVGHPGRVGVREGGQLRHAEADVSASLRRGRGHGFGGGHGGFKSVWDFLIGLAVVAVLFFLRTLFTEIIWPFLSAPFTGRRRLGYRGRHSAEDPEQPVG